MMSSKILNPMVGVGSLLALVLSATIATADSRETIRLSISTDSGLEDSIRIDDLPVGATEVFTTESGREALVTRNEDSMTLELDGEIIDVLLPSVESIHEGDHGSLGVFLSDDELPEGTRKVIIHSSSETEWVDDEGERHVVIHKGDGPEVEELMELGEGVHEVEVQVESSEEGEQHQEVIVIKRRSSDDDS